MVKTATDPVNVRAIETTDRCIVCPHKFYDHHDYRDACWCKICNKEEIVGPCSYYFINVHRFEPPPIQSHLNYNECIRCKLSPESSAHSVEFRNQ